MLAEMYSPDELRARFDRLAPELERRAAELLVNVPDPPPPSELVEATWRIVCSRRVSDAVLRADAIRELDCSVHNFVLRRMLAAGELDRVFAYLQPHLRGWATNLSRRLPEPRPDAADLVQDAFVKLQRAAMFAEVNNPLGYAFRVIKNLVVDHARRARETVPISEHHLPIVEPVASETRLVALFDRAGLASHERCMVMRVVVDELAVGAAHRECGAPPGAPYYVLHKIFDRLADALGVERKAS